MSKRRTKKQKIKAKHLFIPKHTMNIKTFPLKPTVKREKGQMKESLTNQAEKNKLLVVSDKSEDLRIVKKDILRSLSLVTLILCLEMVIYFFMNK